MDPVLSGPCSAFGVISFGDPVWILAAVAALSGVVALAYQRRARRLETLLAAREAERDAASARADEAESQRLRLAAQLAAVPVAPAAPIPVPPPEAAPPPPGVAPDALARLLDPLVRHLVATAAESPPAGAPRPGIPLVHETAARAFLLARGVTAAAEATPGLSWHALNALVTAEVERRRSGDDAHSRVAVFLEPGLPVLPLVPDAVRRLLELAAPALPAPAPARSLRIRTAMTQAESGPAQRLEITVRAADPGAPAEPAPETGALAAAGGAGCSASVAATPEGWTATLLWPSPDKPVAVPPEPAAAATAPGSPPPPAGGRRILLAEDDPFVSRGVSAALRRGGHRVTCATDGTAALALLRLDPAGYDLVFTDLNMPGVGGRDLLVALNRDGVRVPVVVLSGYITSAILDELQQLGAARILRKPVRIEDLLAAVEQPHELLDPAVTAD